MKTVYLGLGSNLGDREAMLQAAIGQLQASDLSVLRLSSVYETEPMDLPSQPWFLNLVVEAKTDLFPLQLLARTARIEQNLGRRRTRPKGPRPIDIDILLYGNFVVRTAALVIPHQRLAERRFVLAPLAELAPELRDPVSRRTVRELLGAVAGQIVRKVDFQPVIPT
jgi:2-amino-4-hydroxy-6-hydroxymethyldihydropteridine diphosphokinase